MSSNAKNFLSTLKELNDANTVKVKVPSTGKNAEFKLASVNQQKDLIRTAFDGLDGVITRTVAVNNIILENSVDDVEFLIIDKPAVLVALRKESIGSDIKIGDKTYDLNTLPAIKKSDVKLTDTLEHDGITVNVEAAEKIKQSVDIVVAYESAKYVDTISVGEDEIKFSDISVTERKDIINNLPLALNNKIIDYIGSIKDVTDKALTVDKEVVVEFDASFLSSD